jgi:hypothetical protein
VKTSAFRHPAWARPVAAFALGGMVWAAAALPAPARVRIPKPLVTPPVRGSQAVTLSCPPRAIPPKPRVASPVRGSRQAAPLPPRPGWGLTLLRALFAALGGSLLALLAWAKWQRWRLASVDKRGE